ncbi:MAG: hypothetical protein AB1894_13895 [Chloroflexota bacterium]
MDENLLYSETLTSNRTEALFLALMLFFLLLSIGQAAAGSLGVLAIFFCLFIVFLFYVVNYRTLAIRLTAEALKLKFGVFTWTVPLDNVQDCQPDEDLPALVKYGGAGIHFMLFRQRYRASVNFLEYPRVVIAFKRKAGPVQDISFSTRQPDDLLRLIREAVSQRHSRQPQTP